MFPLPRVMGHRGAAGTAPENTLAGLRAAADQGARWVEFDVMLSGDGVPMLFHDDSLKRITGRDAMMARTPLAALRKLDAGAWFGPEFNGEPIPTLEEALELLLELGLSPNIEIKPSKGTDEATARAAMETLICCWRIAERPALVSSFSRKCLAVARDVAPEVARGLLLLRPPRDWPQVARALECSTIHVAARWISSRLARDVRAAGYGLACFTVNDPAAARRLVSRGVDCIITDMPGKIGAALA